MKNDYNYELRYLPLFYDDVLAALDYIGRRLKNPKAADELLDKTERAILERQSNAESFEVYCSARKRDIPYYSIYVDNYVIYYVVIEHKIMEVRRFLYRGRDRDRLLR
ncbi:MAG: type II toxin-antitoxin system RelE/ParE family toxin [Lachnospiraceae bacterium]|jgi:plasmid stabilization system protein ParE|nr:type II toxin-antitoxin system RelE/ParE family toxin [Lachnospiraceae bacterium]